jgi:hypothetical protein
LYVDDWSFDDRNWREKLEVKILVFTVIRRVEGEKEVEIRCEGVSMAKSWGSEITPVRQTKFQDLFWLE